LVCTLGCALAAAVHVDAQGRRGPGAPAGQGSATTPQPMPNDPLVGPIVTNAPYVADAVTTITQTLADGTRIEQKTEAKFFRDSAGRVRREQTILGLNFANRAEQTRTVVTIDPLAGDQLAYTLDPAARTARRGPRALASINPSWFTPYSRLTVSSTLQTAIGNGPVYLNGVPATLSSPGSRPVEESLGTRQMEGVRTTGRKTTNTIPAGQIGNDRPIEVTDERWESPELKMLIYSRFSDPRTGVVEYRLTNINRAEPPADLFAVPADYTILEPGVRGGRAPGPGGRGPQ